MLEKFEFFQIIYTILYYTTIYIHSVIQLMKAKFIKEKKLHNLSVFYFILYKNIHILGIIAKPYFGYNYNKRFSGCFYWKGSVK